MVSLDNFFTQLDVFGAIGEVLRHIVPLHRELFARRRRLAVGEEHLLETTHVVAWRRQQVLLDLVVPVRGQIDILDVSGRLTIENSTDNKPNGSMKARFIVLRFDDGALVGEVVAASFSLCMRFFSLFMLFASKVAFANSIEASASATKRVQVCSVATITFLRSCAMAARLLH
jgi:hypothetical protein